MVGWVRPVVFNLGQIWQRLKTVLTVTAGGWGESAASGIQWVETRDVAKYPTKHRTAPQKKKINPNGQQYRLLI